VKITEKKLRKLIHQIVKKSTLREIADGDFNITQIDSFSRGEESYSKIRRPENLGLSLMTFHQFQSRINSIGCFWGTVESTWERAPDRVTGTWTDERVIDTSPHSKKDWNRKIRETNRISGGDTSKYTGIQAGDDLYYVPFLFYRNKPIFIYGPVDLNRFEIVRYDQLYDDSGYFKLKDSYSNRNIPIYPVSQYNYGEFNKSVWTHGHFKSIGAETASGSRRQWLDQAQDYAYYDISDFLSSNRKRFRKGIVVGSNAPEQLSGEKWSPAEPSGIIQMDTSRPQFTIPSFSQYTWSYDRNLGVYKPSEPINDMKIDLVTKEELDEILGSGSYVVNDDGVIEPKI